MHRSGVIAVLYAYADGPYAGLDGVDVWCERRDARNYAGPHPVVAHPPCSRWCRLAGLVEARWGHVRGQDDGTFAHALAAVRAFGGVLEHPAYSDAWSAFDLPVPPRHGGWVRGICGGWACHVEQGRYGHAAKKATWLYAVGCELPAMRWGSNTQSKALVSWCGNRTAADEYRHRPRVGKRAASETPAKVREVLLGMARSVYTGSADRVEHMPSRARSLTPEPMRDALVSIARTGGGSGEYDREHAETRRAWQRWLVRRDARRDVDASRVIR